MKCDSKYPGAVWYNQKPELVTVNVLAASAAFQSTTLKANVPALLLSA